ncbi:lamin tail domain-containing protein [Herpetosiphon sp. NSE202]|uniref:lamin tail domain-containing protein n=1 Tax=Herpetosiphon sp. NSE202 TaxID=3351349 RepID=UPI0036367BC0
MRKPTFYRLILLGTISTMMLGAMLIQRTTARATNNQPTLVNQPRLSTTLVISEFRTRGSNGAADEFVELYNLSAEPVSIGGWKLNGSSNSGTVSTRATIPNNTVLLAGCRYLVVNSSGYSGSTNSNLNYTTGVADDGGFALLDPNNVIIDMVGMSTGSAYKEGTSLAPTTSNLNQSYERKPGGSAGNGIDTDNNQADFSYVTGSNPQNTTAACTVLSTPTVTPIVTATATVTPTLTTTPTLTATATNTPTVTLTPSQTATATATNTPTLTATPTITPTLTATNTPTVTLTPSQTATATATATNTPTVTLTPSQTATATATATNTPTITLTPSQTATATASATLPTPQFKLWLPLVVREK